MSFSSCVYARIVLLGLLLCAPARAAFAAQTSIDFETFPGDVPVTRGNHLDVQYAPWGLVFLYEGLDAPFIDKSKVYQGSFLAAGPDTSEEFGDGDFRLTFLAAQETVQLGASTVTCPGADATLTAFDQSGTPIRVDGPRPVTLNQTLFTVATTPREIYSVSFHVEIGAPVGNCDELIDDLFFEGDPAPPLGPPPSIILTSPPPGTANFKAQPLVATGTFGGTNLFPQIQIDLITLDTPTGQPSTQPFFISLSPAQTNGTNIPFSLVLRNPGQLAPGRYRVVAKVKDLSGQQAQASVDFANFPPPLVDPGLGPFRFGLAVEGCPMGFYQNGAVADVGGFAIIMPAAIAEKWLAVDSPMLWPHHNLGCPLGPVGSPKTGWVSQHFQYGRIYDPPDKEPVWIQKLLGDALTSLSGTTSFGGEAGRIGLPVGDPSYDLDADNPTWVFQRFSQNDLGPAYWNTLEVRGRTPVLYVERIGGDPPTVLSPSQSTSASNPQPPPVVTMNTPTIWEQFPCTKLSTDRWPTSCNVSVPIPNLGPRFDGGLLCGAPASPACQDQLLCSTNSCPTAGASGAPPDWVPRGFLNHDLTVYQGLVNATGAHLAATDSPFSHDNCNPTLGRLTDEEFDVAGVVVECTSAAVLGIIGLGGVACYDVASGTAGEFKNSDYCRSDWSTHTYPLNNPTNWTFMSEANASFIPDFEIEFEAAWAENFFQRFLPTKGDLVTAHGRPIVDCGHCPYHGEIHPLDMMIVERSFTLYGELTDDPERRFTDVYVWGNGFLPGEQPEQASPLLPVSGVAHAPPRTAANARLIVQQHENGYFRSDLVTGTTELVPGGMKITFSGDTQFVGAGRTTQERIDSLQNAPHGQWHYPAHIHTEYVDNWRLSWTKAGP